MTDSLKALIEACRNGDANYQDLVDRVPYEIGRTSCRERVSTSV